MRRVLFIVVLATIVGLSRAQDPYDNIISVSADFSVPLSNKEFAGNNSTGIFIGFRKMINDHFYLGFDFNNVSYNDYKPRQTYYTETGAYTTDFHNYVYSYGLAIAGDYFFTPEKRFIPFAGLGIGGMSNTFKEYYNIYTSFDTKWGLLVRPEAGALIKVGRDQKLAFFGVAHYDYSTTRSPDFNYDSFNAVGFRIGVSISVTD